MTQHQERDPPHLQISDFLAFLGFKVPEPGQDVLCGPTDDAGNPEDAQVHPVRVPLQLI